MDQEDILVRFVAGLEALAPEARRVVENNVRAAILGTRANEVLTLRVGDAALIAPTPSIDYAKALWCFLRNTKLDGADVESSLNDRILAAVQDGISEVLLSEKALVGMIGPIELPVLGGMVDDAARSLTQEEIEWLRGEVSTLLGFSGSDTVQAKLTLAAADNAVVFLKSAAGATMLKLIATMLNTTAGKAMAAKLLQTAAAKAVASTAFKTMAFSFVKKTGVVLIIKAGLGALVAAGLPMHRFGRVPPQLLPVLILGALGFFFVHELRKLPEKLAQTLPDTISSKIAEEWRGVCEGFVAALTVEAFQTVAGDTASAPSATSQQISRSAVTNSGEAIFRRPRPA